MGIPPKGKTRSFTSGELGSTLTPESFSISRAIGQVRFTMPILPDHLNPPVKTTSVSWGVTHQRGLRLP